MFIPDPDRPRRIVMLAREKTRSSFVKEWLFGDERGFHEKTAEDLLLETAAKAAELGLTESQVDEEIAAAILYLTLQATINVQSRKAR